MYSLSYTNIEEGSNCDYSLKPKDWSEPIVVVKNWLTQEEVKSCNDKIEANLQHAICNLSYSPDGKSNRYSPMFRRSADLNSRFFPREIWNRMEKDALKYAIDNYGAPYEYDKPVAASHEFATVYRKDSGFLGMHSDAGHMQADGKWYASVTTRYEMTSLVYLNTSGIDFAGGIIRFPYIVDETRETFEYVPSAGDALFFPANPIFAHEVTASTGNRNILANWKGWRPYKF
jgi:hypothetical protein